MSDVVAASMPAYRPRRIESLGVWAIEGFQLKAYGITSHRQVGPTMLTADVMDAARCRARVCLSGLDRGPPSCQGFAIVHAGEEAIWLLLDWWKPGGVLCQVLSRAELAAPGVFRPVTEPIMACVWELVVVNHERDAWVRHMLTRRPSVRGYIEDRLPDGVH